MESEIKVSLFWYKNILKSQNFEIKDFMENAY